MAPYSMVMYGWTKQVAVQNNGIILVVTCTISFTVYMAYAFYLGKRSATVLQ